MKNGNRNEATGGAPMGPEKRPSGGGPGMGPPADGATDPCGHAAAHRKHAQLRRTIADMQLPANLSARRDMRSRSLEPRSQPGAAPHRPSGPPRHPHSRLAAALPGPPVPPLHACPRSAAPSATLGALAHVRAVVVVCAPHVRCVLWFVGSRFLQLPVGNGTGFESVAEVEALVLADGA